MKFVVALVATAGYTLFSTRWESPRQSVTSEQAWAIRNGCGVVENDICVYDGCFRSASVVEVGPLVFRTLSNTVAGTQLPTHIVIEHRLVETWNVVYERYNVTGTRAVECFAAMDRIFGTLNPTV